MWEDKLKSADVNIHVIATGAASGFQHELWSPPGSSAYLSGASFPYSAQEQEEILGFMPEHFCSQEAAVDLASAAYMKAYQFGGKKPVGIGITASVASEKEHRGEHKVHACIITENKIITTYKILPKSSGQEARCADNSMCQSIAFFLLLDTLELSESSAADFYDFKYQDATELASQRFWSHSLFLPDGRRLDPESFKLDGDVHALMPGAFNPPHQGHFGLADKVQHQWGLQVFFEICATHPIKPALTVQEMLQRAKLLRGHPVIFSKDPLYIDKARRHPNMPFVVGADAMLRLLDPKWGTSIEKLVQEFADLDTEFFIADRKINGKMQTRDDVIHLIYNTLSEHIMLDYHSMFRSLSGRWDISSTEIRNKLLLKME